MGSVWCLFAYGYLGLLYPAAFISTVAFVRNRIERNAERAMIKTDLMIDSERQEKAIDEYVALVSKNKKKTTKKKG
jgi:hypothetical protein